MSALMLGEIDQLRRLAYTADGRLLNSLALADQRDDAAVMIGVHLAVEQVNTADLHSLDNGVNACFVAALRKIRNAFHQRRHNGEEYRLQLE